MIQVFIIEDEKPAVDKLMRTLNQLSVQVKIIGVSPSIKSSVEFLRENPVDLIFSDIHLSDGLSFEIFKSVKNTAPIIFITAYDTYAIEAFKTLSIDYLLKPLSRKSLQSAMEKYYMIKPISQSNLTKLIETIDSSKKQEYKRRFLVQSKDLYYKIEDNEIAYFFADGKYTFIVTNMGRKYFSDLNIRKLEEQLDPKLFFKINRKYILHINSIVNMIAFSKSRIKIKLDPPHTEDVIVSVDRSPVFKQWLGKSL